MLLDFWRLYGLNDHWEGIYLSMVIEEGIKMYGLCVCVFVCVFVCVCGTLETTGEPRTSDITQADLFLPQQPELLEFPIV